MYETGEDSEYFCWLAEKVANRRSIERQCGLLLYKLYSTEFKAIISGDEHRIDDVAELREEFEGETGYIYSDIPDIPCTVLELLITLSNRIVDILGDWNSDPANWFWVLLNNLVSDDAYFSNVNLKEKPNVRHELDDILGRFVDRKYNFDGSGGIFPLKTPKKDQKRVEIWYQMQAYLNEIYE